MSATWVRAWLRESAAVIAEQRSWLTDLDAAIGDGDHGINLDRGFRRVVAMLDETGTAGLTGGELLAAAGRAILGSVGGASGALYGRALLHAGATLSTGGPGAPTPDAAAAGPAGIGPASVAAGPPSLEALARAFDAAVDAVASLGRSAPGDKTMLDALVPATLALRVAAPRAEALELALARAADAAAEGLETTRALVARRGRASYLGARSAGHLDPGAASSVLLVRALAATVPAHGE